MDRPWYRKLFSRPQQLDREASRPSADYGDADVQFRMGLKFAKGDGAAQDYVQAAEWYRKAADQNHSRAQFNLGVLYVEGLGVTRDDAESSMWFGRAAHQGNVKAQFNLGRSCHRTSFGGLPEEAPESRIEAYKWYQLAAAQGCKGSHINCAALVFNMTREDIAAGDQRVAAFAVEKTKLPQE